MRPYCGILLNNKREWYIIAHKNLDGFKRIILDEEPIWKFRWYLILLYLYGILKTLPMWKWRTDSVQFSSFTQLCLTLCNPKDCSIPGFPVHHHLGNCSTHVQQVGDALQPSYPLSSPSPPAFNLYQQQGLFQWVSYWKREQICGSK